jgi:hypothetical protein
MVQIVTPGAIILASDSKMVDSSNRNLGSTEKIVQLNKNLAVASCDMSRVNVSVTDSNPLLISPREYNFNYDFRSWIRSIPPAGDVLVFTDQVAATTKRDFADYGLLVRANAFSRRSLLVEYYVAGYSDGIAQIRKITLPIDWDNAVVMGPIVETRFSTGKDPTFGFNAGCVHQAIDQVIHKSGLPYARAQNLAKEPLDKMLGALDLTIEEAKALATALITVESEFSPEVVGLPVQTVVIEKPPAAPR